MAAPTQSVSSSFANHRALLGAKRAAEIDERTARFRRTLKSWDRASLHAARDVLGDPFERFHPEGAKATLELEDRQAGLMAQGGWSRLWGAIRRRGAQLARVERQLRSLRRHTDVFTERHGERLARSMALEQEIDDRWRRRFIEREGPPRLPAAVLNRVQGVLSEQQIDRLAARAEANKRLVSGQPAAMVDAWRRTGRRALDEIDTDGARTALRVEEAHRALEAYRDTLELQARQLEETGWRTGRARVLRLRAADIDASLMSVRAAGQELRERGFDAETWMEANARKVAVLAAVESRTEAAAAVDRREPEIHAPGQGNGDGPGFG